MYSISINSIFCGGGYSFKYTRTIKILFLLDVSSIYSSFVFCLVLTLLFSPGTFFLVNASSLRVYESWDLENSDSQENMKLDKTIISFVSKRSSQFPHYLKQTNKKSSQKALQQAKNSGALEKKHFGKSWEILWFLSFWKQLTTSAVPKDQMDLGVWPSHLPCS